MNTPRVLREQIKAYEKAGFHVTSWECRSGSHFKLVFKEFSEPQFVSKNVGDPRSLDNNIARFKRLAKEQTQPCQPYPSYETQSSTPLRWRAQ
jgi:hypothetical protein